MPEQPEIGDFAGFRQQMPVAEKWAYLDHAAVGPLTSPTQEAISKWLETAVNDGDVYWPEWSAMVERTRRTAAELIGADYEEIALMPNTTAGITLVAEGCPWSEGDNVVIPANEFPSNAYPWMNLASRGVETRRVAVDDGVLDLDRLFAACDENTRLISVSWIGYATGYRIDLAELVERAHQRSILVFVDAIQGLGVFPINVKRIPIDFLAADGHKWMLGPEGAGMFFTQRANLNWLRPIGVGWNSVQQKYDFDHIDLNLNDEASRYEGGSQNMVGMHGFGASLKLLQDYGLEPDAPVLADRVREITDYACERLTAAGGDIHSHRDGDHWSGIVSFSWPGEPQAVRKSCIDRGVVLSCRGGRLRLAAHAYNDTADVDRLMDALSASGS
ncbi:MAG: aminotransferase class V-fold PLP-dependent enzyme [bacterium]|nr:aminotransferase class V-fold PLP-dependent enzyme [bacterium]